MILLTGSGGLIGKKLLKRLEGKVTHIDKVYGSDIMNCWLPNKADTIYHLAAQTSVEKSWQHPFNDSLNFPILVRIHERYPEAKIIYAQSAAAIEASSPYGFSKKICGDFLKKFHPNHVICVFPNVYGGKKSVVDIFKGKEEVTIYGDGKQVRDFVHVDDIVEGLLLAQNWPTGEYLMGSGIGTRIKDLARGKTIINAPARKEIRESVLPNSTPNWRPKISVLEYMKKGE